MTAYRDTGARTRFVAQFITKLQWWVRAFDHRRVFSASLQFACGLLVAQPSLGADAIEGQSYDYRRATRVSVDFGEVIRESGLHVVEVADSQHTVADIDGETVWFFRGGWNYAYFAIDPDFKENLGTDVVIRAEYQILGRNPMGVHYDGLRGPYSSTTDLQRDYQEPDSNWRVIEFRARDARFRNSQNRGADFRIHDNEKGFYLKHVSLARYQGRRMPSRNPSTSSNLVDLTSFYNASLRLYMPGGDVNSLTNVLRAIQTTTGVHFDARGYIGLLRRGEESGKTNSSPEAVKGIPIGRRLNRLHFLHSASYGENEGRQVGSYIIHLSDGSMEEFPIVYGRNVRSERGDYRKVPDAEVAWEGEGIRTGAGRRVRMFKVTWNNPTPTVEVSRVDFISAVSRSAPHLLAITVEPRIPKTAVQPQINADERR